MEYRLGSRIRVFLFRRSRNRISAKVRNKARENSRKGGGGERIRYFFSLVSRFAAKEIGCQGGERIQTV